MSLLESLPVEILNEICSLLCDHCAEPTWPDPLLASTVAEMDYGAWEWDHHWHGIEPLLQPGYGRGRRGPTPALAALCRTSRFLRIVAQPYFYHSIKCSDAGDGDFLPQLVLTLASNPHLAQHVKNVEIVYPRIKDIPPGVLPALAETAKRLDLLLPRRWAEQCGDRDAAIIQLLLLHLPNAATMTISLMREWIFGHWWLPAIHNPTTRHCLRALTKLCVLEDKESDLQGYPTNEWLFTIIMAAENLKTLALEEFVPEPIEKFPLAGLRNIVHLSIHYSLNCVSADAVTALIQACDRLEVFHMKWSPDGDELYEPIPPHCVLEALEKHTASLRILSLLMEKPEGDDGPGDERPFPPARDQDLRHFEKLESLWIHLRDLKCADSRSRIDNAADDALVASFPPSLERLYLADPVEQVFYAVVRLASAWAKGKLPALKEVAVRYDANFLQAPAREKYAKLATEVLKGRSDNGWIADQNPVNLANQCLAMIRAVWDRVGCPGKMPVTPPSSEARLIWQ
ncbi:hypothetical protein QBC34DRAFT_461546 [Podospora aff. communis PSN243]|uniref:F-box domain-containing protein n=1 Tax=Podospora aff. communis PSN243 TaxID=3040156 RepID=A0AAV9GP79_9PEZI|nr:hypothetical protein QBC34DRAFT_461546 [Podospora aff. communis PSN243]